MRIWIAVVATTVEGFVSSRRTFPVSRVWRTVMPVLDGYERILGVLLRVGNAP